MTETSPPVPNCSISLFSRPFFMSKPCFLHTIHLEQIWSRHGLDIKLTRSRHSGIPEFVLFSVALFSVLPLFFLAFYRCSFYCCFYYRCSYYRFSFSKSLISVSSTSSFDGAGGAGGAAGASSFFLFVNFVSSLMNKNIEKAMMRKSKVTCRKLP